MPATELLVVVGARGGDHPVAEFCDQVGVEHRDDGRDPVEDFVLAGLLHLDERRTPGVADDLAAECDVDGLVTETDAQ
jgi:hypothetical protein